MTKKRLLFTEKYPRELPHYVVHGDYLHFHFDPLCDSAFTPVTKTNINPLALPMLWQVCHAYINLVQKQETAKEDYYQETPMWQGRMLNFFQDVFKQCSEKRFFPKNFEIDKMLSLFKDVPSSHPIYHLPGLTPAHTLSGSYNPVTLENVAFLTMQITQEMDRLRQSTLPKCIDKSIQKRFINSERNFYVCITGLRKHRESKLAYKSIVSEIIKLTILQLLPRRNEGISLDVDSDFELNKIRLESDEMIQMTVSGISLENFYY